MWSDTIFFAWNCFWHLNLSYTCHQQFYSLWEMSTNSADSQRTTKTTEMQQKTAYDGNIVHTQIVSIWKNLYFLLILFCIYTVDTIQLYVSNENMIEFWKMYHWIFVVKGEIFMQLKILFELDDCNGWHFVDKHDA